VYFSRGHTILTNHFVLPIDTDMVFVAIVRLSVFFGPASVYILLSFLGVRPVFWRLTTFDLLIFLTGIALPGYWHNSSIDNLTFTSQKTG